MATIYPLKSQLSSAHISKQIKKNISNLPTDASSQRQSCKIYCSNCGESGYTKIQSLCTGVTICLFSVNCIFFCPSSCMCCRYLHADNRSREIRHFCFKCNELVGINEGRCE